MEILGYYEKQPDEVIPAGRWGIDWDNDLASGETISTCTVTVTDADGTDVTDTLTSGDPTISGTETSIIFTGGTDGETYTVEMQITTSEGGTYEGEFCIEVTAIP